jgi:hypothetical protein
MSVAVGLITDKVASLFSLIRDFSGNGYDKVGVIIFASIVNALTGFFTVIFLSSTFNDVSEVEDFLFLSAILILALIIAFLAIYAILNLF